MPAGWIVPGIPFDGSFHAHCFSGREGISLCNDMLSNFDGHFDRQSGYGWTSGCSISSLLINLAQFFADPDQPFASDEQIERLKTKLKDFSCQACQQHIQENTVEPEVSNALNKPSD